LRYGDGSEEISGTSAEDSITLAGVTANNLTMGIMNNSNIPTNFASIAGLGWPSEPCQNCGKLPSIVQSLYTQGKLSEQTYSMWLGSTVSATDSRLFFGGDHSSY